ncbi:MAG: DEAD/DEAH box helicase [Candidatus Omnitrophota bacterium]|nr:DEAD/DEAH box helicase [Candidatus Omnitrophota bacterium]
MEPHDLSFNHLGIAPKMLQVLERMKFVRPTPIQHSAIPIALGGQDVVGVAQTGTGKTIAFGIPIVQGISANGGGALVLTPTRELAIQVGEVMDTILRPFNLTRAVLIGGAPMLRQITALKNKPHVIIATPGRLIDHLQQKTCTLKHFNILVLDEADRMLDMGFAPQVEQVLRQMPRDRQTMLFSATMPADIVKLATRHMKLPIHIEMAPSGTAAEEVTQELFIVTEEAKRDVVKMLASQYRGPILLFTRTKLGATRVRNAIKQMGDEHKVAEIHSDRSMGQRKEAIEGFKSGRYRILVATDVAARGLDVTGIELVINYDLPEDIETYVHRIGRTGRAGQTGHAVTFATPGQGVDVGRIERLIRKSLPRTKSTDFPAREFRVGSRSFSAGRRGRSFKTKGRGRR